MAKILYQVFFFKFWLFYSKVYNECKNGTPPEKYTAIATFLGPSNDPYNDKDLKHAAIFVSCGINNSINVKSCQNLKGNWSI